MKHHIDHIYHYELHGEVLTLHFENRQPLQVYLDGNSGRPIKRQKIDTVFGVKHTGVRLGTSLSGETIVAHNHYKVGRPAVATYPQFSMGEDVLWDDREHDRPGLSSVKSSMNQILNGNPYTVSYYNCQHFVNLSVRGERKSESLRNMAAGIGFGLFAIGVLGLLMGAGSSRTS
jgi:hypothetical protein